MTLTSTDDESLNQFERERVRALVAVLEAIVQLTTVSPQLRNISLTNPTLFEKEAKANAEESLNICSQLLPSDHLLLANPKELTVIDIYNILIINQ